MSHHWIGSIEKKYCKNHKKSMAMVVVKKRLLNIILQIKMFLKKRQEIGTGRRKEEKEAKKEYSKSRYKQMKKNANSFLSYKE